MTLESHRWTVEQYFSAYRGKHIFYYPTPGNGGDCLITLGSLQCFEKLGIGFSHLKAEDSVEGATVVLGGGGNFTPLYGSIRREIRRALVGKAREIILLPHTIRGNEDMLSELGAGVTLFCRDLESYRHVQKHCHKPTVLLAPDMAFHIELERALYHDVSRRRFQPFLDKILRKFSIDLAGLAQLDRVHLMREDVERAGPELENHFDLSKVASLGTAPDRAEAGAWCFLEILRRFRAVTTDRLHVAIGAALLGKECLMYDNSYGKNAEVYQYSLKYHYRNVTFAQAASGAEVQAEGGILAEAAA